MLEHPVATAFAYIENPPVASIDLLLNFFMVIYGIHVVV